MLRSAVKTPSYFSSSVLGQNALKMVEGAVKRKEVAHSSGQSKEKKKKSALDEIMEVIIMQDLFLCTPVPVTMSTSPLKWPQTFSSYGIPTFTSYQVKSFHFPIKLVTFLHKTGCSTLPIPHMTEVLGSEYWFCKRRKYLETLAKKNTNHYHFVMSSWIHQMDLWGKTILTDPNLGFGDCLCSPHDTGLENWFKAVQGHGKAAVEGGSKWWLFVVL